MCRAHGYTWETEAQSGGTTGGVQVTVVVTPPPRLRPQREQDVHALSLLCGDASPARSRWPHCGPEGLSFMLPCLPCAGGTGGEGPRAGREELLPWVPCSERVGACPVPGDWGAGGLGKGPGPHLSPPLSYSQPRHPRWSYGWGGHLKGVGSVMELGGHGGGLLCSRRGSPPSTISVESSKEWESHKSHRGPPAGTLQTP